MSNNRKSETYAQIDARKVSYQAYATPTTPNNCYIGVEFDAESQDVGKYVLLNSRFNRYDSMPAVESPDELEPIFAEMTRLMSEDESIKTYHAIPRARDYVNDLNEAKAAGKDLDTFRAEREARLAAEKAAKEKDKEIRARAKELGIKTGKNGAEIRLEGEMLAKFVEFAKSQKAKGEIAKVAQFAGELIENGES